MLKLGCIMALSLFSCAAKEKNNDSNNNAGDIRCVRAMQILPTLDSVGNLLSIDTSTVQIYYLKDKMLYQIEDRYANIRYSYFSTSDLGKTGYFFSEGDVNNAKLVSGESVIKYKWFEMSNLDRLFDANHTVLLKSDYDSSTQILHEHYEFKEKRDTAYKRYADLYLAKKMSDLYVKFTHDIDKKRNMRVMKFQLYTPKQFSKGMNEIVDQYTLTNIVEDVELSQAEQDHIRGFFK